MSIIDPKPLVSVITPFLNTQKYFTECIESVISQMYTNWELILIDDGSTDNSSHIALEYAKKYPEKIFYLQHDNHQNLGASASRNLGIQHSHGEYIAFLDSDDIYGPLKLADQVTILNNQPNAGMLYASTEYWFSWTGKPEDQNRDWIWDNFGVLPDTLINPPKLLTSFLTNTSTIPCMGSVLLRRKAIESVGGWENSFTHIYTDQVFHAKICLNWPVYVAKGCWDRYRQHAESSCYVVERTNKAHAAKKYYLKWLRSYLESQNTFEYHELWLAYHKAYLPFKSSIIENV